MIAPGIIPDATALPDIATTLAAHTNPGKAAGALGALTTPISAETLPGPTALMKAALAVSQKNLLREAPTDALDILDALGTGSGGTRTVTVSGAAVPAGVLTFASLSGTETLSELFSYTVQLKTPDKLNLSYFTPGANLPLKPMVGKELTVNIELDGGGKRHISGLVTAARVAGHQGRGVLYELTLQPWLKLATRTSDYKIFQNKSVVNILDEVLSEYPFPVEKRLIETYPRRTYQVQYGETDYDFLQRLMEEFGICYYFEHQEGLHKLILTDAMGTHPPVRARPP